MRKNELLMEAYKNTLETEFNLNDLQTSSSYRAVNTHCLSYKNQPVNAV